MKKRMRAQAGIITIVVLVVMVLAAIVIVFNIINPVLKDSSRNIQEQTERLSLSSLNVENWKENPLSGTVNITVKAGAGESVGKANFILNTNSGETCYSEVYLNIQPLETRTYLINSANCTNITSIDIQPIDVIMTNCTDSDGGINYNIKGYIKFTNSYGQQIISEDKCHNQNLEEEYCGPEGYGLSDWYLCPNGCIDGACVAGSGYSGEITKLEYSGDNVIQLYTKIKDGYVTIPLVHIDTTTGRITGLGRDATTRLATSNNNILIYNATSSGDDGFVVSWSDGRSAESYYLKASVAYDSTTGKNLTTISNKVTGENICTDLDYMTQPVCPIGGSNIQLTIIRADYTPGGYRGVKLSVNSGGSFNMLYTANGLQVILPYWAGNSKLAISTSNTLTYNAGTVWISGFVVSQNNGSYQESYYLGASVRYDSTTGKNLTTISNKVTGNDICVDIDYTSGNNVCYIGSIPLTIIRADYTPGGYRGVIMNLDFGASFDAKGYIGNALSPNGNSVNNFAVWIGEADSSGNLAKNYFSMDTSSTGSTVKRTTVSDIHGTGTFVETPLSSKVWVAYVNSVLATKVTWNKNNSDGQYYAILEYYGNKSIACTPNCIGKICGDDGCGGSCGSCMCYTGTPLCVNGNCTCVNLPADCTDSDGGKNYLVQGNITIKNRLGAFDYCVNKMLFEQYCDGNYSNFESYTCPINCLNGACSDQASVCSDTDEGTAVYKKGTAAIIKNNYNINYTDYCSSNRYLIEYMCFNENIYNYTIDCMMQGNGYTCSDGACIAYKLLTNCTDSDGGINYNTRGIANSTANGIYTDHCAEPDSNGYYQENNIAIGHYLREYYCLDNGYVDNVKYPIPGDGLSGFVNCSNVTQNGICQNGACVQSCTRNCNGKSCGSDGCGGTCGTCSGSTPVCNIYNQCVGINWCLSDSGCHPDFYSGNYCGDDENIYHYFYNYYCSFFTCRLSTTSQNVYDCENGCENGECISEGDCSYGHCDCGNCPQNCDPCNDCGICGSD